MTIVQKAAPSPQGQAMLRLIAQFEADIAQAKQLGRGATLGATYSQLARMKDNARKLGLFVERKV